MTKSNQVEITCGQCNGIFFLPVWRQRYKIKTSKSGKLFCSTECRSKFFSVPPLDKICYFCKKTFQMRPKEWRMHIKSSRPGYSSERVYCSKECVRNAVKSDPNIVREISEKQRGISVPARGRLGHTVNEEVKEKIRLAKIGVPSKQDYEIVVKEMERRGITRYANMTKRPIPDAIFLEDGKLVAVEVEKERWLTGIKTKMQEYKDHRNKWDKVILVWYSQEGRRMKEWILENGDWIESG